MSYPPETDDISYWQNNAWITTILIKDIKRVIVPANPEINQNDSITFMKINAIKY